MRLAKQQNVKMRYHCIFLYKSGMLAQAYLEHYDF